MECQLFPYKKTADITITSFIAVSLLIDFSAVVFADSE